MVQVFREVRRVLKKSGTCWLNLGDSYARDAGVTFRGYGKHAVGRSADVFGRNGRVPGAKPKDLLGIPWQVALALRADGWYLRQDVIWEKPNALPESVRDRPTRNHEYVFLLTKEEHYWYDFQAIKEPATVHLSDKRYGTGGGARKRDNEPWNQNGPYKPHKGFDSLDCSNGRNARSIWKIPVSHFLGAHFAVFPEALAERCIKAGCPPQVCAVCRAPFVREIVKTRHVNQRENSHVPGNQGTKTDSTEWSLMATDRFLPACKCAGEGAPGIVMDPFGGSGTVTLVSMKLNRNSVYIDIKPEYGKLALERCGFVGPRLIDCHEHQVIHVDQSTKP